MEGEYLFEFIPAGTLRKIYEVFGHFYTVVLKSGVQIDCRSVLEIVIKQRKPSNIASLLVQDPDAIFVMMNPGSSEPCEYVSNIVSEGQLRQLAIALVPTKPDTTQYQVMRVMHFCGWDHVRVLNISDMRDPKSGKFIERFRSLEDNAGFTAHSLFADERNDEMTRKLKKKSGAPIVFAWGVSPDLDPLIERCLNKVSAMPGLTGILKPNTMNKYFHPLPTLQDDKIKWVN
jgi:hypothetical protein